MKPYQDATLSVEARVEDLLARMTLEEKAAQLDMTRGVEFATKPSQRQHCSVEPDTDYDWVALWARFGDRGVGCVHDNYAVPAVMNRLQKWFIENSRLGIPCIFTGEALHGISGTRGTVFPVPLALGATFDPALVHEVGGAIGRETRALGMHEILAPNLDVARDPRWGRTEETFGEDTHLSSRMAVAIVSGEQKGDISRPDAVATEPKHFALHGVPEGGLNCSPMHAGKREAMSVFLPVFEAAIREGGANNLMACYSSIDGDVVMCSHEYLTEIAKEQMGLPGYIRSDWGGIGRIKNAHHLVTDDESAVCLALTNGLDVQGCDYPNEFFENTVCALVQQGRLDIARVDDAVRRVLSVKFRLGLFEHPYTDETAYEDIIRCDAHRELALRAAQESIVLLKNDGVLPMSQDVSSIALIGPSSAAQKIGGYSSVPTGYEVPSLLDELRAALGDRVRIRQCNGCAISPGEKTPYIVDGQPHLYSEGEERIDDRIDEAVEMARGCEIIIAVCGDNTVTSGEGRDRSELTLSGRQRELIVRLCELGKPVILVLENGKPLDISVESGCCAAVLSAWFGGELGARAIADVLLGKVDPSGRLPISFPRSSTATPCYYSMLPGGAPEYMEGPRTALYPFGYGLSYTQFAYSDLAVDVVDEHSCRVDVRVTVRNVGKTAGTEVVQLYIDDVQSSVATPPLLLKGFARVTLQPGQAQELCFALDRNSFKLVDVHYRWVVESGQFRILIGSSSRDIRLEQTISLQP